MGGKKNIKKKAALGKKNTKTNACVLVFVGVCSWGVSSHVYVYMCVWWLVLSMHSLYVVLPGPLCKLICVLLDAVCLSCQSRRVSVSRAPKASRGWTSSLV